MSPAAKPKADADNGGKYTGRGMGKNAQHSSATPDHGTPGEIVELGRRSLGGIDLDPASSDYWNHWTVKARRFYTERDDGLTKPWFGRMFINPPGDRKGANVSAFWRKLIEGYTAGEIDSAVWVGFSFEQLTYLQFAPMHPLQFVTAIPSSRLDFLQRMPGGPPKPAGQPTHGNYITLLPTRSSRTHAAQQTRAFVEGVTNLEIGGALVRPL